MKIDRFVKAMLVLIALLLVLNCVTNLSNMLNSRENSGNLIQGSRAPLIENKVEAASSPTHYKVVGGSTPAENDSTEQSLNDMSARGWEYAGSVGTVMIFKK